MGDPVSILQWVSLVVTLALVLPMAMLMATVFIVAIGSLLARRKSRQRHIRKVLGRLVELAGVMQLRPTRLTTWLTLGRGRMRG